MGVGIGGVFFCPPIRVLPFLRITIFSNHSKGPSFGTGRHSKGWWSPSLLHSTRCLSPICSGRLQNFAPAYTSTSE